MDEKQFIGILLGIFVLFLFLVYGVFSDILGTFIDGFGIFYGIILGILICLIIVISIFEGIRQK